MFLSIIFVCVLACCIAFMLFVWGAHLQAIMPFMHPRLFKTKIGNLFIYLSNHNDNCIGNLNALK